MLKAFTCVGHVGFYPIGTASVIIAKNEKKAHKILLQELTKIHADSNKEPIKLIEIDLDKEGVYILNDGNY